VRLVTERYASWGDLERMTLDDVMMLNDVIDARADAERRAAQRQ
jgi:hypothetical protein